MDASVARAIWHRIESINAVTYFAPECREAPVALGLRGFWMGYFAGRAAPMGEVGPGIVEATFFNFHPARVGRAIPDAWAHTSAAAVLDARAVAAAAALRRIAASAVDAVAEVVVGPLRAAIDAAPAGGRSLFAANRDVAVPDDPVAALWQATTTLREHRGDGHVALLTGAGLDGCEAHVLFAATEGVDHELFLASRGWSEDDWQAARERLHGRGLVDDTGGATPAGRALRSGIEDQTDALAFTAYAAFGDDAIEALLARLAPIAQSVAGSGAVTYPNPMGLPRFDHR